MYISKYFSEDDNTKLLELVQAHPLATLITQSEDSFDVNHIPFISSSPKHLHAHIARANPLWKTLSDNGECTAVFHGPQSYISPGWYPSKKSNNGKAVPTWNYAVVHVHGSIKFIHEEQWLKTHLEELTRFQEAALENPWQLTDAPEDYINKMIKGIVGIEFKVQRMVGKYKVSQNRDNSDKLGVIVGLNELGDDTSSAMAKIIESELYEK